MTDERSRYRALLTVDERAVLDAYRAARRRRATKARWTVIDLGHGEDRGPCFAVQSSVQSDAKGPRIRVFSASRRDIVRARQMAARIAALLDAEQE